MYTCKHVHGNNCTIGTFFHSERKTRRGVYNHLYQALSYVTKYDANRGHQKGSVYPNIRPYRPTDKAICIVKRSILSDLGEPRGRPLKCFLILLPSSYKLIMDELFIFIHVQAFGDQNKGSIQRATLSCLPS